jgi:hypothetical protein
VVCIVTADFLISQWCFAEVAVAKTLGSKLLPLAVEPGVHHPLLDDLQHVVYHNAQQHGGLFTSPDK